MLRAIHVRLYVNFMKARGYDPAAVLEGSGIREHQLADPRVLVDASQCHAVASNILKLTGKPFIFRKITCAYPAPPHWREYEKRVGCKPAFNEKATRALVRSPTLEDSVQTGDRDVRERCIRHCTHLVQQINRTGAVRLRLRDVLMHCGMIPDLNRAAVLLNTSSRTLRRHLRGEGMTFQRVLDDLRRDLSREYLSSGVMAIKEIAYLLGFAGSAGFCRAYKTWTGETVGEFTARASSHVPGPGRPDGHIW